jgi:hypothetical protein
MKRERQEARERQRVEYLSITRIQAACRSFLCRRRIKAIAIIKSILRSALSLALSLSLLFDLDLTLIGHRAQANQNALTAAFWAAKKITKFSGKVSSLSLPTSALPH